MKALIVGVTLGIASAGFSSGALAVCPGTTRVNEPALSALLTGATVCVPAVTVNPMKWQELHQSGGALLEYGTQTTPEPVGSWKVTGTNRGAFVEYTYDGGGGTYTYSVYDNGGGRYSFCSSTSPEIIARIQSGGGRC